MIEFIVLKTRGMYNLYCKECIESIYSSAFSKGECLLCKTELISSHTPCEKYCKTCADNKIVCQQCGDKIAHSKSEFKRLKIQTENNNNN